MYVRSSAMVISAWVGNCRSAEGKNDGGEQQKRVPPHAATVGFSRRAIGCGNYSVDGRDPGERQLGRLHTRRGADINTSRLALYVQCLVQSMYIHMWAYYLASMLQMLQSRTSLCCCFARHILRVFINAVNRYEVDSNRIMWCFVLDVHNSVLHGVLYERNPPHDPV